MRKETKHDLNYGPRLDKEASKVDWGEAVYGMQRGVSVPAGGGAGLNGPGYKVDCISSARQNMMTGPGRRLGGVREWWQ